MILDCFCLVVIQKPMLHICRLRNSKVMIVGCTGLSAEV